MNFKITMTDGVCKMCKKKELVANDGACLSCVAKYIRSGNKRL